MESLTVLYVHADKKMHPTSFDELLSLLDRINGFNITIITIDNYNESMHIHITPHEKYTIYNIGGDNTDWEFSGWKRGINFVKKRKIISKHVLFVNDSFVNEYGIDVFKSKINTRILNLLNNNQCVGMIDKRIGNNEILMGFNVETWIRTHFFIIPLHIVKKLNFNIISERDIYKFCPRKFSGYVWKNSASMSNELKLILQGHLTGSWYQSKEITKENWDFFRNKFKSMLNEKLLTQQLKSYGVTILDIKP